MVAGGQKCCLATIKKPNEINSATKCDGGA
jgi:hypothetical protein